MSNEWMKNEYYEYDGTSLIRLSDGMVIATLRQTDFDRTLVEWHIDRKPAVYCNKEKAEEALSYFVVRETNANNELKARIEAIHKESEEREFNERVLTAVNSKFNIANRNKQIDALYNAYTQSGKIVECSTAALSGMHVGAGISQEDHEWALNMIRTTEFGWRMAFTGMTILSIVLGIALALIVAHK